MLFLDTPLEVCIARVEARRAAAGNLRPFNPKLLGQKHATIARLKDKFGTRAISVSDRDATATIMRLLKQEQALADPWHWSILRTAETGNDGTSRNGRSPNIR